MKNPLLHMRSEKLMYFQDILVTALWRTINPNTREYIFSYYFSNPDPST